jgi:hypothetical protein
MSFVITGRCLVAAVILGAGIYAMPANAASGFTGAFDISTWSSAETYGGATFASVDSTKTVLTMLEPDSSPETPYAPQEFTFSHVVGAGRVSFNWSFDASGDACCSGFNFYVNGTQIANLAGGSFSNPSYFPAAMASGTFSTIVARGDIISFAAFSEDSCCGASINTVSDFHAAGANVPEPAAWALMLTGFGLTGYAMRRRATVRNMTTFA